MADKKKLGDLYRSVVPAPPVEEPATSPAVVPSAPVAAPAPTPTAALPPAPTAKTPAATRPAVRKPAVRKPMVIDLKQMPTIGAVLPAPATKPSIEPSVTTKPLIEPAAAAKIVETERKKQEAEAVTKAAAARPVEVVSTTQAEDQGDVLSGDYYTESKDKLKKLYGLMPVIAREAQARGQVMTPDQVRREAARRTMFYTPVASSLIKKQATPFSPFTALGAVPEVVGTMSRLPSATGKTVDQTIDDYLADLKKREDFVREREAMAADPLTDRLLKEMTAQKEKFKGKVAQAIPPKLVADFQRKYVAEYMVQNGYDKLTNEAERKAREAEGATKAREALDNLRAIGNPIVSAGLDAVTTDTVRAAAREGFVPYVKELGKAMLPQQVTTASGAAVRTESIPMTLLRDIDIPNAVISGFIPLPGEGRAGVYRGDPFLRVQRGQTILPDVIENDWFRESIDGKNGAEGRAAAAGLLSAAAAFEIFMPGLEGAAAVGAAGTAKAAGKLMDKSLEVADAIKVARTGIITTERGIIPISELPGIVNRTVETVKRARSVLATNREVSSVVESIADSNLARTAGGDDFIPAFVNLEMDASSPALSRIYRDNFLRSVTDNAELNELLNIIVDERRAKNAPFDEFHVLASNDATVLRREVEDIRIANRDKIDSIKTEREATRGELADLERQPSTPEIEQAKIDVKKKYQELSSELTKLEKKGKRLDAISDFDPRQIARATQNASRQAVERMLRSDFYSNVAPIARVAVPGVDVDEVRAAFGGTLVSTDEAIKMASHTNVADFIKNKSSKTATEAEKRLAEQLVQALEASDLAPVMERFARAGATDPFEILRALSRVDAEAESVRASKMEQTYDRLWRQQTELEVEVNRIIARNIEREDAAVRLEEAQRQYEDALKVAEQSSKDLQRARSIKVPKQAVKRILDERIAALSRVPAPGVDATSPAAVRAATSEQILNETIPSITMDADSVPGPVARQAQQADLVRTALREKVDNKTMRRLIELRHGTDRTMPYAVTGEPWNRPDYFMLPRPSSEGMPVTTKEHSLKLHKERTANNNVKYIMQDGDAQRKKLAAVLKQFEAEGNPKAEGLRAYLESGSAKNDAAKAQFAQRMGIPTIKDYTTLGGMFDKGGLDEVYKKFDEIAAANPDVPRARGENVYYRWLLNRSAPDGMEPSVIRMDDYVEVRSVARGKEAGLIPQHVVLPDGSTTFMSGGFVGDRFMGRVVGAVEREGKTFAVVNVYQYGPGLGRRAFPMTGKTIEVPADEMILFERGRTEHVRYGTDGGEYPELRPMLESEWSEMFAREDAAFGNLKGKLSYSEGKNAHVYNDLNPPKRPTIDDFDFYTEADLVDAVDRQIPLPRMEVVEGAVDAERPTLVPAMEQAAEVVEERPTEKVFVMGRAPEEKPVKQAAPLTARDRRVGRMKIDAVNAAVSRRSDALELLEQRRTAVAEARSAAGKVDTERIQALEKRIDAIEQAKIKLKKEIDTQQSIASAAIDIERVSTNAYGDVLEGRRAVTEQLIAARDASRASLKEERAVAKQAGEVSREPVSLELQVNEETRRIAASQGGIAEVIRGVQRLGSGARESVEGTLSASLRAVVRKIDRNRAEAELLINDGIAAQNVTSPNVALTVMLDRMDASNYGQTWAQATASGILNKRAIDGVAFAYIDDVAKLTADQRAALRNIVTTWQGDLNGLAKELDTYAFNINNYRDRATGDIQLAQSVATQTIIDGTIAESFGLGALFNKEEAMSVNAWLTGETGRNAMRGRELILSVMSSAVDTGVPIRGLKDLSNNPVGRKILRGVQATGAEVAADASAGSAFAASMDAFAEVYAGSAFFPEPVAAELNRVINDMIGSTRTRDGFGFASLYKKDVVYGLITPRTTFFFNNGFQDADQLAVATGAVNKEASRSIVASALNGVLAIKGVSIVTGLVDVIRGLKAGTTAGNVMQVIAKVEDWLALAAYGTQARKVMGRSEDIIEGIGLSGQELWRIGSEAGVGNTFQSVDILRGLNDQFDNGAKRWFKTIFTKQTDEIGAMLTERKRWGAFVSVAQRMIEDAGGAAALGRAAVEATVREAARITTEAFMDYSANLHPIERHWIVNVLAPFWAYEKSNMIRTARLMTTGGAKLSTMYDIAKTGYRFGVWTRKKEVLAEIASFFLENRDEYGFDADSMKKDDEARAEQMRAEGKTDDEIKAAMLYPVYEQALEQAKSIGIAPREVRNFGTFMTDDRMNIFNPFLDYSIPDAPLYFEPDQYSRYRAPFSIIIGDAKLQSWAVYNDYLDQKNKYGSEDMLTYIMPPDDGNLYSLHRSIAGANLLALAGKGALGMDQEKVAQSVAGNVIELVGDPLAFSPQVQAIGELVMQSYDKENAVNIAPMRVSPYVGKMLHSVNLAVRENRVVDVDMQQTEFGSTNVKVEEGYVVPKQIALGMRAALPSMVAAIGTASQFEEMIDIQSSLVTETDERVRQSLIQRGRKLLAGLSSKTVSKQQVEARAEQQIVGDVARYGMGAGTRLTTPLTPEQLRSEALQRAEVKQPSEEQVDEKRRFVYAAAVADPAFINEGDLRMVALKYGFATEEEMKTLSRYDIIDRIANSVPARKYIREEMSKYLAEQTADARKKITDNAVDRVGRNIGDGRNIAIVRSMLQERGLDTDSMTNKQIVVIARKMRAQ